MAKSRIVVDGSNIATEGRTVPSLAQLEDALTEIHREYPKAEITVVVDATFAHRIDPSELKRFETGIAQGEFISPPAGAIGRGDAFVLKIAEKSGAVVLSNDSFQEFHGEHAWLFESDRLIGASPVPGVGWIFMPRNPVRGAKSRAATRGVRHLPPMPKPKTPPPGRAKKTADAVVAAEKKPAPKERAQRRVATSVAAVNDPTTFITFIAAHPVGGTIEAEVESFTSHGAIVRFQNVQCYAPLSGLGSPAPRSPREVLERGEIRKFVIRGLDPERRGIELALPGVDQADGPSRETTASRPEKKVAKARGASVGANAKPEPPDERVVKRPSARKSTVTISPPKKVAVGASSASKTKPSKASAKSSPEKSQTPKRSPAQKTAQKTAQKASGSNVGATKRQAAKSTDAVKKSRTTTAPKKLAPAKSSVAKPAAKPRASKAKGVAR